MSMQPPSLSVGTPPRTHHRKNRISIRWSLPLVVMAPVVIGIALTSWLAIRSGKQAIELSVDKISEEVATNIQKEVTSYLEQSISLSEGLLAEVNSGVLDLDDMRSLGWYFWHVTKSQWLPSNLYYGNQAGEMASSNFQGTQHQIELIDQETEFKYATYQPESVGQLGEPLSAIKDYDPRTRPWYQEALQKKQSTWTDVYIDVSEDSLVLTRTTPVVNDSGDIEGVFGTDIFLSELSDFLKDLAISRNGRAFILQKNGNVIATSTNEDLFFGSSDNATRLIANNSQDPLIVETASQLSKFVPDLNTITDHEAFQFTFDGKIQLSQVYTLENLKVDWLIAVTIPQDDYMKSIHANTRRTIVIGAGITIVASLLALGAALYILQPIETLNQAAEEIKHNQLDPRTLADVINRPDEFSTLAEIFEDMAMVVMSREQSLAEQVKHLETEKSNYSASLRGSGGGSGGDRHSLDLAIAHAKQARQRYQNR